MSTGPYRSLAIATEAESLTATFPGGARPGEPPDEAYIGSTPRGWNRLRPGKPMLFQKTHDLPTAESALPGRSDPIRTDRPRRERPPAEGPLSRRPADGGSFAMGCFWGVERLFWKLPGVWVTAAGYAGGYTPNPTYEEVCSGRTGHTEAVLVVYDPKVIAYADLLKVFWENHDPTQGMRQGNDQGTQYRSAIFTRRRAERVKPRRRATPMAGAEGQGQRRITTDIEPAPEFYFAEDYHQGYLGRTRAATAA